MNFPGLLFLLITQYLSGSGLLHLFKINLGRTSRAMLSMICGTVIFSLLPFILQLCHVPITIGSVSIAICVCTVLFCIKPLVTKQLFRFSKPASLWPFHLYEYPFLVIFVILAFISIWHTFYFPPLPRDLLSGPEVIAEYTVREHTMINSVFSIDLHTTNNYLKPPYLICLQIIYKLLVCPFGQVWLSPLFICFTVWLYVILRNKLHPLVACAALLIFFSVSEIYAYTCLVLFDYSNMVFFFAGFYFLARYAESRQRNEFFFSALMFGFATYIRSETLALMGLMLPMLIYIFYKEQLPRAKAVVRTVIFYAVPAVLYYLWFGIFVKHYMPVHFSVDQQMTKNFSNLSPLFNRFSDMNTLLIFSKRGDGLWGYMVYIFLLVLLVDLIIYKKKKLNSEARIALYGVAVVYFGICLLGYIFPLIDLWDTTKRGLFKMFPLMLLYMRNSPMLQQLSQSLTNWEANEQQPKAPKPAIAQTRPVARPATVQKPQQQPHRGNNKPQPKPGKGRK